ncbi:Pentatricopeptide repeat-containing protein [Apostasia shenzhenica]|uniref:Pentatricopeptide repeat-containing protein n=1 Tax=Apostasia shenzhenica TaxID=1088818 RepID=A0A2I0AW73_9ASPA|nr:Pentatricopeptide repeat-containing protein [Apostasia shenzhenica]
MSAMVANPALAAAPAPPPICRHPQIFLTFKSPEAITPQGNLHHYLRKATSGQRHSKAAFISAMKLCSSILDIPLGRSIHAQIVKCGVGSDRFIATSIVGFYSLCGLLTCARQLFDGIHERDAVLWTVMLVGYAESGDIEAARILFDEMPERDVIAWNAMLTCYLRSGFPAGALNLFQEMQIDQISPNEVTIIGALSACSQMGCLDLGMWIHASILKKMNNHCGTTLDNALMNMYAKCAKLDVSLEIFLKQENKNLESWNTLLTGLARSSWVCRKSSLSLFSQMMKIGVWPDRISLLALLMACSHAGMTDDALRCFICVPKIYGVEPETRHYGCLVDALSRGGRLDEARMLIEAMPLEPDAGVWGALLGGCLAHRSYELGIEAAKNILELEQGDEVGSN